MYQHASANLCLPTHAIAQANIVNLAHFITAPDNSVVPANQHYRANLTGRANQHQPQHMNSSTFSIDAYVTDKIKSTIDTDEYTNMAALLPPRQTGREVVTPKKRLVVGEDGSVSIQADDERKLISWTDWTDLTLAWNVFQFTRKATRVCARLLASRPG